MNEIDELLREAEAAQFRALNVASQYHIADHACTIAETLGNHPDPVSDTMVYEVRHFGQVWRISTEGPSWVSITIGDTEVFTVTDGDLTTFLGWEDTALWIDHFDGIYCLALEQEQARIENEKLAMAARLKASFDHSAMLPPLEPAACAVSADAA